MSPRPPDSSVASGRHRDYTQLHSAPSQDLEGEMANTFSQIYIQREFYT